jgi:FkbM family methyltransferase
MFRKQLGKVRRKFGALYRHQIHPLYLNVANAINLPMVKRRFVLQGIDETTPDRQMLGWSYGSKYLPRYEILTRRFINEHLSPGDVCIDVGANIGIITVSMVDALLRQKGNTDPSNPFVFAIEPSNKNREILLKNLQRNRLSNYVNVSHYAIGTGVFSKKVSINSVFQRKQENKVFDFISLDEFALKNNIERLKIIKIDVDGFELDVLAGADDVLTRLNPIIVIELDPVASLAKGHETSKIVRALNQKGYKQIQFLSDDSSSGNAAFAKTKVK